MLMLMLMRTEKAAALGVDYLMDYYCCLGLSRQRLVECCSLRGRWIVGAGVSQLDYSRPFASSQCLCLQRQAQRDAEEEEEYVRRQTLLDVAEAISRVSYGLQDILPPVKMMKAELSELGCWH